MTKELSGMTDEPWRTLRFYSSSALAELTPKQLEEWAGASRQAIHEASEVVALREALTDCLLHGTMPLTVRARVHAALSAVERRMTDPARKRLNPSRKI